MIAMSNPGRAALPVEREVFVPARRKPELVRVPAARCLSIAGKGSPESEAFQSAIAALYAVAFTLKFARKRAGFEPFRIAPLEGLWWGPRPGDTELIALAREQWRWKLLIRVPDSVSAAELAAAKAVLLARRGMVARAPEVALEALPAEDVVQILHVGPFASEEPSIARMAAFIAEHRLAPAGPHHEVYLGDPRRSKPERLRTILRQAVLPSASPAAA